MQSRALVTLTTEQMEAVDEVAREEQRPRSQMIRKLVIEALEWRGRLETPAEHLPPPRQSAAAGRPHEFKPVTAGSLRCTTCGRPAKDH